jgi:hypothetical protein
MGKAAKKHRAKVAARNLRLSQKKSAMQKAFDTLIQQQMEKMKEDQELTAQVGDQEMNFEIVEDRVVEHAFKFTPNEEESTKINKEFDEVFEEEETSENQ